MTIKDLKWWVVRQRKVLKVAYDKWFDEIEKTKQDWLEQKLLTLFDMIAELEEK